MVTNKNDPDKFMTELGIEKPNNKKKLSNINYRHNNERKHCIKEKTLEDVGYEKKKVVNSPQETKVRNPEKSPPMSNSVISVINVISKNLYNKYNKYNNITNITICYNDLFERDNQANKIKWNLFILSSIKEDFKGLNYSEMARVSGVVNIQGMGTIAGRMRVSGEIKLYNKDITNPVSDTKNCYILTENAENEIKELIKEIYLERIKESKKRYKINEFKEKLDNTMLDINNELGQNEDAWEIIDKSLVLDYKKLLNINPTLISAILDNPAKTIQELEKNLNNGIMDIFKNKSIRIKNIPKIYNIQNRKIKTSNIDKLYTFDVEVITSTEILPATTQIKYECPSCGTIMSILQEAREEKKQPNHCSCGRRGGFKEISKDLVDYRTLLCADNQEAIEDSATPRNKRYHLLGDIANIDDLLIESSSKLKITGIPILKESKQGDDIDVMINHIESNDELLVLDFSEKEKEKFKQFSKENPIEVIKEEIFDLNTSGYNAVKRALIIQQIGGVSKNLTNGIYKRAEIHMLLIGDPSTAKSALTSNSQKLSTRCAKADSNRGTSAGLTGTFEYNQQLGRKVRMPGLINKAKGGILIWEEFNEADESVQATLKTPLESSEYSVTLATGSITSRCPFSFLATMNPKGGNYLDYTKSVIQQVPLSPALKTRFDLIFGGFTKPRDKDKILNILETQDSEIEIEIERFKFLKKYLAYCKLKTTTIPKEIKDLVNQFCLPLIKDTEATFRIKNTLNRLIESFAKAELKTKATTQNFEDAKKLFLDSLQSTSLNKNEYDYSRFVDISEQENKDMNRIEISYNQIKDKDGRCNSLDLFKQAQLESKRFNYALRLIFKRNIIKSKMIKEQIKDDRI